jgi:hypothetical protein
MDEKEKDKLRKKYKNMEENLQNESLFLEPQNKKCQYKECLGYFEAER